MESEGSIDYEAEWERAHAYNEALLPSILPDSFAVAEASDEPDEEYMACLNIAGDEMMGTVEIPKINIELPIYHTTDETVLERAAGHLEGSSLPVGGESTHAVLQTWTSWKKETTSCSMCWMIPWPMRWTRSL